MKKYVKLLFISLCLLFLVSCNEKNEQKIDFTKIEESISKDLEIKEDDDTIEELSDIEPFPIEERLANVSDLTKEISGIDTSETFITDDLIYYQFTELDVMDEIILDLLDYLETNYNFENPKEFHSNLIEKSKNAADKYIADNELDGDIATLEYNGYLLRFYYEAIRNLSESYLSIILDSYDDYSAASMEEIYEYENMEGPYAEIPLIATYPYEDIQYKLDQGVYLSANISSTAEAFLIENLDLFPSEKEDYSPFVNETIKYRHITKNPESVGQNLIIIEGQVWNIREVEIDGIGTVSFIHVIDHHRNNYYVVYYGTLPNIFDYSYITVIGLTYATVTARTENNSSIDLLYIISADAY